MVLGAGGIYANLAPNAFHILATHHYKCRQDFKPPHRFSPVPYFLLCCAIELELKSRHPRTITQEEVKKKFSHDLVKAYKSLPESDQCLDKKELSLLRKANSIYPKKGCEYIKGEDALTGYRRFPDLELLDNVARKLINP